MTDTLSRESLAASYMVQSKLDEFFWEWLALPESQKLVREVIQYSKGELAGTEAIRHPPSPSFESGQSHAGSRAPGSPLARGTVPVSPGRNTAQQSSIDSKASTAATAKKSPPNSDRPVPLDLSGAVEEAAGTTGRSAVPPGPSSSLQASPSHVIPAFYKPKAQRPTEPLPAEFRKEIADQLAKQGITEIKSYKHLEPIVTTVFGLSKYLAAPILHKVKVFHRLCEAGDVKGSSLLSASTEGITEGMFLAWCQGHVQPGDPVLTFYSVVKQDHNDWIERDDFGMFLSAILSTHPGLEFLQETSEFQDRYADTVVSRIFFLCDRRDTGRIHLRDVRRVKPSIVETWKQLAEQEDIKLVRDYFSYEHFYVIYCTFWELDADHDFLLDKDDLIKYDGHALSRRVVDRIFSEVTQKFTSAVPGKMGYEDFIYFLLCDQDRQSDRSLEYWFYLFDLDGDGCISRHEMQYFYEEQVQRMECLHYETIPFADIICQMNDMIFPAVEGQFRLSDLKRQRKFAGTFFSVFSSLNKFLAFEHRDPFSSKQDELDNPSLSEWDRWCANKYLRLATEDAEDDEDRNYDDDVSNNW
eukprot:CAMPEP_0178439016 /NCGR_PEP_ID=MMETSP0689_2-20121128/35919_1 /TAXON_ID=160604 /ORGANISM="Amphidinium massartii, Strain CS-259" /LENGTH=582 /DNA_ID=CAMNT_0020061493 /DNA_START=121 /DNA_END=1866 /DNA_ORIENTATION=-